MTIELDLVAFLMLVLGWLGPVIYNALRRRFLLLHPISALPIAIVYYCTVALFFRFTGDPKLKTALLYSGDEWFLAGPMMFLSLMGPLYHVGVRCAGLGMRLRKSDAVDAFFQLKTRRNAWPPGMFLCATLVLGIAAALQYYVGMSDEQGGFWAFTFYTSIYVLPLIILQQHRMLGSVFLLLALPSSLLRHSKAAFGAFAVVLGIFFQQKIFSVSRVVTVAIISVILMTPISVYLYATWGKEPLNVQNLMSSEHFSTQEWQNTLDTIIHREYAFESFAIVFQRRLTGEPLQLGTNFWAELTQMIPHILWPDKPVLRNEFPTEYLSEDWNPRIVTSYTKYFLTPIFLDFDFPGCCIFVFILGLVLGYTYRKAKMLTLKRQECWPMILYVALVMHIPLFVGAGLPIALTSSIGVATAVCLVLGLSEIFVIGKNKKMPRSLGQPTRIHGRDYYVQREINS